MIKISFVIFMLTVGAIYGGWWGMYSMLLISAICLAPFMGHSDDKAKKVQFPRAEDWNPDEEVVGGIKGTSYSPDPTRPTVDDYAAMITDNYGHRRK